MQLNLISYYEAENQDSNDCDDDFYDNDDIDYELDEDDEENGELKCRTGAGRPIGSLKALFLPHLMLALLNHAEADDDRADADADADDDAEDDDD